MRPEPTVTTLDEIYRREAYQSLEPVRRPSYWGVDLEGSRRPGVPMMRAPKPFANARFPIERQPGVSAVPKHNRTNKAMPPVFGTATPLHGLSGVVRKAAYKLPDHKPAYWLLKLFGDRVDSFTYHTKKYAPVLLPVAALVYFATRPRAAVFD